MIHAEKMQEAMNNEVLEVVVERDVLFFRLALNRLGRHNDVAQIAGGSTGTRRK